MSLAQLKSQSSDLTDGDHWSALRSGRAEAAGRTKFHAGDAGETDPRSVPGLENSALVQDSPCRRRRSVGARFSFSSEAGRKAGLWGHVFLFGRSQPMGCDLRHRAHVSMMDRWLDFIFAPFISRAAVDTYRILIISAPPSTTQPCPDPPPPGYQPWWEQPHACHTCLWRGFVHFNYGWHLTV